MHGFMHQFVDEPPGCYCRGNRMYFLFHPDQTIHWSNHSFRYEDRPTRRELIQKMKAAFYRMKFTSPVSMEEYLELRNATDYCLGSLPSREPRISM